MAAGLLGLATGIFAGALFTDQFGKNDLTMCLWFYCVMFMPLVSTMLAAVLAGSDWIVMEPGRAYAAHVGAFLSFGAAPAMVVGQNIAGALTCLALTAAFALMFTWGLGRICMALRRRWVESGAE